jgi:multiple antibiotic resistance protein
MSTLSFGILCFSSLFTVIDPIAAAPVFASMTKDASHAAARRIAIRACAVALGVLLVFAVSGAFVFRMFGITIDAFRIGGGLVFLALGLPMLTGSGHDAEAKPSSRDPSVVPLGVPLIGGPGSITTVMVLMGQSATAGQVAVLLAALVLAMIATCAVLVVSPVITKRLGHAGLELVTKVMGLIILVIGIQFIIDGVRPVALDILRAARGA